MDDADIVHAAGGVIVRGADGHLEAAVIHRPKYDDWSLPKGKLEPGEDHLTAARREVEEETGAVPTLLAELSAVEYRDRHDRPKRVRYWLMRADRVVPRPPDDEVDEIRWVDLASARRLLSYEHDRELLDEAAAVLDG